MPTRSPGSSCVCSVTASTNSWNALRLPRTRFTGMHLAVPDREDRLHVHQLSGERLRAPDAAAAREELERVDREEQAVLAQVALDERVDLLVGRAALEPALDRGREHRGRDRRALGVDRPHPAVAELRSGGARALERAGEIRRDVDREDALVASRAPRRPRGSRRASAATSSAARATCAAARRTARR